MDIIDWGRIKYPIHTMRPSELVCDRFRDLKTHRAMFMTGSPSINGIPPGYDTDDFILRYIIYLDSPGTPADDILDPNERKAWALKTLGVKEMTPELMRIGTEYDRAFVIKRAMFLRLQYSPYYRMLKQLEAELTAIETSQIPDDEREAKSRQDRMKVLVSNIQESMHQILRTDHSKNVEEALMALVTNENMGIRPEEIALEYSKGNDPLEGVSILIDSQLDNL